MLRSLGTSVRAAGVDSWTTSTFPQLVEVHRHQLVEVVLGLLLAAIFLVVETRRWQKAWLLESRCRIRRAILHMDERGRAK